MSHSSFRGFVHMKYTAVFAFVLTAALTTQAQNSGGAGSAGGSAQGAAASPPQSSSGAGNQSGSSSTSLPPGLSNREQLPPGLNQREQLPPGLDRRSSQTLDGSTSAQGAGNEIQSTNSGSGYGVAGTNQSGLNPMPPLVDTNRLSNTNDSGSSTQANTGWESRSRMGMTNTSTTVARDQAITQADRRLLVQVRRAVQSRLPSASAAYAPVHFVVNNGVVTLAGEVAEAQQKQEILTIVQGQPGITRVVDQIQVSSSGSSSTSAVGAAGDTSGVAHGGATNRFGLTNRITAPQPLLRGTNGLSDATNGSPGSLTNGTVNHINTNSQGLPPGLEKHDTLPPGLEKRDSLPPGLEKRGSESGTEKQE